MAWRERNHAKFVELRATMLDRLHLAGHPDDARLPCWSPLKGAKTVRVRIAMGQTLNRRAIARMRAMKNELYGKVSGGAS